MEIIMLVLFDKTNMLMVLSIFSISLNLICDHISITGEFAMKNFSDFVNYTQGGSHNINQTALEIGHRQGRTYGHLVSFLLATFLTKAVAKYATSSLFPLSHQPLLTNKPVNYLSFNQIHQPNEAWKPSSPFLHGLTAFAAESYQNHYSQPDPFQPNGLHETEVVQVHKTQPSGGVQSGKYDRVVTTIESPDIFDQSTSQSQYSYRRQLPPNRWNYYPRRGYPPQRRENGNRFPNDHRYPYNRFRTTTPYYDYYENYDDSPTRQTPYRTRRPAIRRRPTTENYDYLYDSSEYDDPSYEEYFEKTTRFYEKTTKPNKRQRKPTKKTKIKKRTDYTVEDISSEESVEEVESEEKEKPTKKEFKPQQRQQATTTTTEASTTETTELTTTEESTASTTTKSTTSSTTTAQQNVTQSINYGQGGNYEHISFTYGPPVVHEVYNPPYNIHHNGYGLSNGNEGISITQNPSRFPLFYHNFPYNNLFPQELTKNAIVQKVHDIVGFDHDFIHRE